MEGLNKQMAMSWKLICLQKDKISLEESAYSMEPVECLSRAVVMVMHSHPHLSEKKVWVILSIFSHIQDFKRVLPQCGVVALVVAARVIRE